MGLRPYSAAPDAENTFGSTLKFGFEVDGAWKVYFVPSDKALEAHASITSDDVPGGPYLLMEGQDGKGPLVTYPLNTNATSPYFLQPKYRSLRSITFEGFDLGCPRNAEDIIGVTEDLPPGCIKGAIYGLGINRDIRQIIEAVEDADATDLTIVSDDFVGAGADIGPALRGESYRMPASLFDKTRRAIASIHNRALRIAQDEKSALANNDLLTILDSERFREKSPRYRKDAIVERLGKRPVVGNKISNADADALMHMAQESVRKIAQRKPKELLKLQNEIELVSLEQLIERFKALLAGNTKEAGWQTFLMDNPFVLHLAFGYPIAIVGGQVSVGGRTFQQIGEKIADIAAKTRTSGNLALIEIKTHQTPLLDKTPYRSGVHATSKDLHGAVTQVLDQRYMLQKTLPQLKDNSRQWDIESYAVQCLVIAGLMPQDDKQQKSLELYRHSLKSVSIVTYDEMLAKLEALLDFLKMT